MSLSLNRGFYPSDHVFQWSADNNILLNSSKTKEIIIDFRKKRLEETQPIIIENAKVDIVDNFKYLGTTISHELKWEKNIEVLSKKAHKRLYFLRQLKKYKMSPLILKNFYRSIIESVITFSITVWFGNLDKKSKSKLEKIRKTCEKIIGDSLPSLESIFKARSLKKAKLIIDDVQHPAYKLFEPLPSKRRYRSIKAKTCRYANSFYPTAVRLLSKIDDTSV